MPKLPRLSVRRIRHKAPVWLNEGVKFLMWLSTETPNASMPVQGILSAVTPFSRWRNSWRGPIRRMTYVAMG
jgi:hypothetical protein